MVEKSAFEEQAKELLGGYATVDPSLVGCIAAALSEARNGAIEECAKAVLQMKHDDTKNQDCCICEIAESIRALRGNG